MAVLTLVFACVTGVAAGVLGVGYFGQLTVALATATGCGGLARAAFSQSRKGNGFALGGCLFAAWFAVSTLAWAAIGVMRLLGHPFA